MSTRPTTQTDALVVVYDDECGFCKWLLAGLLRLDRQQRLRPVPLQGTEADALLADLDPAARMESWHLVGPDGSRLAGGAALAALLRQLPGGRGPAAGLALFPNLTAHGYRWVAEHRSQLSRLVPRGAKRRAAARVHEREAAAGGQAAALVEELHARQGEMYAGGAVEPVLELLAPAIVWHVPGRSPIAGDHRGRDEVAAYFERRRTLASATMRMHPGELVSNGDAVAQLVAGTAVLGGEEVSWQTVGVYRVDLRQRRIREVWLVPLDAELFDRIWLRR